MSSSLPNISRRGLLATAGIGSLGVALTACAGDPDSLKAGGSGGSSDSLVIMEGGGAWGEAQREAFFEPFEKETGIKVTAAPTVPQAQLRTAIESGKPGFDLIDVEGPRTITWTKAGLLEDINYELWKDPGMREEFAPAKATDTSVPSLIYAVQLAYNKDLAGGKLNGWADMWDAAKGKMSLRQADGPAGATFEIALLADGVDPKDLYPIDFDRAFKKLDEIKPQILKFWSAGAEPIQMMIDKQTSAVSAWDGRVEAAISDGADYIEGTFNQAIIQTDNWAIPKGSENIDGASLFIEFASLPENQAKFSELITYAPSVPAAYDHLSEERKKLFVTNPEYVDSTVVQDVDFWASEGDDGRTNDVIAVDRWQEWLLG